MAGKIELKAPLDGVVTLEPEDTASNYTVTLPATDATLLTDSAGVLNIGSGQIYKDADGNVGLGTSSPDELLHIVQTDTENIATFARFSNTTNATTGFDVGVVNNTGDAILYNREETAMRFATNNTERMRITALGGVEINTGYVTLNGNQIGGIQVTIADDAFAEITPPRIGGGFVAVSTSGEGSFPDASAVGFLYADWGDSVSIYEIYNGIRFETSTSGPPTGTTGSDVHATLFIGGTSGKVYLENRLGGARNFQLTFT